MRRVVENLGLSWPAQRVKLAEGTARFACSDIATHDASGRVQMMLAMPVRKLNLWLATINPNKITDLAKRQKIEWYQEESAVALFNYWNNGCAVRGDLDGIVTGFDPKVMNALGGMMKGIVAKALSDVLPQMVQAQVASGHYGIARGLTAGEVLGEAGVTKRKGLRGLARRVSDHLRRYHSQKGVAVPIKSLGASTAYVFDLALVREWLLHGGRQLINLWVAEKGGQGALKLVSPADPRKEAEAMLAHADALEAWAKGRGVVV